MNTSAETARQDKATELRRQGYTYEQIAQILRVTPAQAKKDVVAYLRACAGQVDDEETVRAVELMRLDALQVTAQTRAEEGDLKAVKLALEIGERRAKLLGLDAPKRVEHAYEALPPVEQVRLLEVALEETRALLPAHEEESDRGISEDV